MTGVQTCALPISTKGEVKKRIDELEEERNKKLRYDLLERELNRYRAISAASNLKTIKLPNSQQDRDMIARELLIKFQMSPRHPLVDLKKAYRKK